MTMTHENFRSLTVGVEWVGHKLYVDNSFSSSDLSNGLHATAIKFYGTFTQNCKGTLGDF
jgi:hypothetical protein